MTGRRLTVKERKSVCTKEWEIKNRNNLVAL